MFANVTEYVSCSDISIESTDLLGHTVVKHRTGRAVENEWMNKFIRLIYSHNWRFANWGIHIIKQISKINHCIKILLCQSVRCVCACEPITHCVFSLPPVPTQKPTTCVWWLCLLRPPHTVMSGTRRWAMKTKDGPQRRRRAARTAITKDRLECFSIRILVWNSISL